MRNTVTTRPYRPHEMLNYHVTLNEIQYKAIKPEHIKNIGEILMKIRQEEWEKYFGIGANAYNKNTHFMSWTGLYCYVMDHAFNGQIEDTPRDVEVTKFINGKLGGTFRYKASLQRFNSYPEFIRFIKAFLTAYNNVKAQNVFRGDNEDLTDEELLHRISRRTEADRRSVMAGHTPLPVEVDDEDEDNLARMVKSVKSITKNDDKDDSYGVAMTFDDFKSIRNRRNDSVNAINRELKKYALRGETGMRVSVTDEDFGYAVANLYRDNGFDVYYSEKELVFDLTD